MNVYKLVPVNPQDSNWAASIWRNVVIIRAPSEEAARAAATLAFGIATGRALGSSAPVNPWRQPSLVECETFENSEWNQDGPIEILLPKNHNEALAGVDFEKL